MTTSLPATLQQLDLALHASPSPAGWFVPLDDLSRIDEAIQEASRRLAQHPAQLTRLLPSLRRLQRHRRDCVSTLVASLIDLPRPQLATHLTALASLAHEPAQASEPTAQDTAPAPGELASPPSARPTEPSAQRTLADLADEAPSTPSDLGDAPVLSSPIFDTPIPDALALVATGSVATDDVPSGEPALVVPSADSSDAPKAGLEAPVQPVDTARIAEFSRLFGARKRTRPALAMTLPPVHVPSATTVVRDLLTQLGPVPRSLSPQDALPLRARLDRGVTDLTPWQLLGAAQQVDLLTLFGALARHLQERHHHDLPAVFSRLTAFSEREQPGYVHGLARKHTPRHGQWLEDARRAEGSLRRWLGDDACDTPRPPRLQDVSLEEIEPDGKGGQGPAVDWPWWSCTRDRRAVLVGGSPRDSYQRRLQQVYGFAKLDWVDGDVRRIKNLGRSIEHRGLDLVLVVQQFISHKASGTIIGACKRHGVPFATIEHGHGVHGVQQAIERFLSPSPRSLAHAL